MQSDRLRYIGLRLAMAGCVLVVAPTAVALANIAPPVPPCPIVPPVPPAVGAADEIIIAERRGSESRQEHVRTVARDGKTFVFKSDKPISDADIEARISRAEAGMPPVPPVSPVPPIADKGERRIHRVIVIDGGNEAVTDIVSEEGPHCKGKKAYANVDATEERDGKVTRVRIRTCGSEADIEKHAMAEAMDGIRQARDEVSRDKSLSDKIRKQVLDELDAEIARLKAKG